MSLSMDDNFFSPHVSESIYRHLFWSLHLFLSFMSSSSRIKRSCFTILWLLALWEQFWTGGFLLTEVIGRDCCLSWDLNNSRTSLLFHIVGRFWFMLVGVIVGRVELDPIVSLFLPFIFCKGMTRLFLIGLLDLSQDITIKPLKSWYFFITCSSMDNAGFVLVTI